MSRRPKRLPAPPSLIPEARLAAETFIEDYLATLRALQPASWTADHLMALDRLEELRRTVVELLHPSGRLGRLPRPLLRYPDLDQTGKSVIRARPDPSRRFFRLYFTEPEPGSDSLPRLRFVYLIEREPPVGTPKLPSRMRMHKAYYGFRPDDPRSLTRLNLEVSRFISRFFRGRVRPLSDSLL